MKYYHPFLTVFFLYLLFWTNVQSAELVGKVTVLKKDSLNPLNDFSHSLVYLTGISTIPETKNVVLNQKNKQFSSRILPIVKGQSVEFWNRDVFKHNIFSTHVNKQFDLGRYPKDQYKTVNFNQLGKYKIYCNIHQKMISDIIVLENHYFSLTDKMGNYNIKNIPAGKYQLHVWNIYGGEFEQEIIFKANDMLEKQIKIANTKIVREREDHKNKFGKPYQKQSIFGSGYSFDDDTF